MEPILSENLFSVASLSAGYGKQEILKHISFSAGRGEIIGLLGANGSGKTTLLKALCGIIPSKGSILYSGQDLKKLSVRRRAQLCSYIPQRSGISISVSAEEAVLMGLNAQLSLLENPDAAMKTCARALLNAVGLKDCAERDIQTLSEGQKQLCFLARTMISDCPLIFLDEPESALDFGGRYRMLDLLRNYVTERQGLALVTLHDPQLALSGCSRLLLLKDGTIQGEIRPETDPSDLMAEKLSALYGPLSIHRLEDRSGRSIPVLIRENDA